MSICRLNQNRPSQDLNPQSLHFYPHQVLKSEMWSQVFIWQDDEGSTV